MAAGWGARGPHPPCAACVVVVPGAARPSPGSVCSAVHGDASRPAIDGDLRGTCGALGEGMTTLRRIALLLATAFALVSLASGCSGRSCGGGAWVCASFSSPGGGYEPW